MNKEEKLQNIFNDISYDINGVWDDSIEDDYDIVGQISSILSYFKGNEEVKDELISLIKYYCYRLYEEIKD
ncbi:MAG: hypothetical protein IKU37_01510 [Candidatus Gastranaerophilales bacterium]|nr:hypothetical protein [Candidatus Gastranaerophilales bacterium]